MEIGSFMTATGIVRPLDPLGRVVIPIELRRTLGLHEKDPIEIFTGNRTILLRKYEPGDIFNGSLENIIDYKGKRVSQDTIIDMCLKLDEESKAKLTEILGMAT